jgi:hypothetical protein
MANHSDQTQRAFTSRFAQQRFADGIHPERLRYHSCWGDYVNVHDSDIPLKFVLPVLLHLLGNGLCIEMMRNGHHGD